MKAVNNSNPPHLTTGEKLKNICNYKIKGR